MLAYDCSLLPHRHPALACDCGSRRCPRPSARGLDRRRIGVWFRKFFVRYLYYQSPTRRLDVFFRCWWNSESAFPAWGRFAAVDEWVEGRGGTTTGDRRRGLITVLLSAPHRRAIRGGGGWGYRSTRYARGEVIRSNLVRTILLTTEAGDGERLLVLDGTWVRCGRFWRIITEPCEDSARQTTRRSRPAGTRIC